MSKYTREDVVRMCNEQDVEFIRLQFTDISGTLKNIAVTVSQLERALDNQFMFDGASVEGFVRDEESDMYDIEKTTNVDCFLGKNQIMYIIYPYGNRENTTEMDIIVF